MSQLALREKDVAALRAAFRRFAWVREVRVFGSRANGTARRASDLDLAVSAPGASATEWSDLCEALEQAPLIYELEILRLDRSDNPRLKERVLREGVRIYPEEPNGACENPGP